MIKIGIFFALIFITKVYASEDFREKSFDYIEDTLTRHYCSYRKDMREVSEEDINEIGDNLIKRKESIIKFLSKNAKALKLNNLIYIDMYPVAKGILDRAISRTKVQLKVVDLTDSKIGDEGLTVLFTALVNRGICDNWAQGEDNDNWLKGLTIRLPSPTSEKEYDKQCLEIAKQYNINFETQ